MKILLITSVSKTIVHFGSTIKGPQFTKKNISLNNEKTLSKLITLNPDIVLVEQTTEVQKELKIDLENLKEEYTVIFYKEGETTLRKNRNIYFLTLNPGDITKLLLGFNYIDLLKKTSQKDIKEQIEEQITKLKKRKAAVEIVSAKKDTGDKKTTNQNSNLDDLVPLKSAGLRYTNRLIVIGASIGGLPVMDEILIKLEEQLKEGEVVPPILYTQHITQSFAKNIITRINTKSRLTVKEVKNNLSILNNHIYMPTEEHFIPKVKNGRLIVELKGSKPISSHVPSIDVMFRGTANIANANKTLAIILTGMGKDGVTGMGNLKSLGAHTVAQEPSTTVVPGIINECLKNNSINEILDIQQITEKIIHFIRS